MSAELRDNNTSDKFNFFGTCLGYGKPAATFWGFLVLGTALWLMIFSIAGCAMSGAETAEAMQKAGITLIAIAALTYLWGFVFSFASIRCALRSPIKSLKITMIAGTAVYLATMFGLFTFFIHTMAAV